MTKSVNKIVFLLVALLMCATVVFAACTNNTFKPVEKPTKADPESNGGVAVKYGEWLYYVNGYTSDVSADNTYSKDVIDAPRVGSVVRIKLSEIEKLLAIKDDEDLKESEQNDKIAAAVRGEYKNDEELPIEGAETVIPKIYYSGNTTTTQFNGIYIFNDRIYVTTPSDKLTANGNPLTDQSVLMSFDLGGGDAKEHFTFTSNAAQIWLMEKGDKVIATYLMDSILHTLDVESGEDEIVSLEDDAAPEVDNTVTGVNWDVTKDKEAVFFIDKFGSVCKLTVGESKYEVIIENDDYEIHEHDGEPTIETGDTTYTIKSARNGIVFYTVGEDKPEDNEVIYWADGTNSGVALPTSGISATSWTTEKIIITRTYDFENGVKLYGIWMITISQQDGQYSYEETSVVNPKNFTSSITIDKIDGDMLYYTANSIAYKIDLSKVGQDDYDSENKGEAYAKNLPSTTGWAAPDFIDFTTEDGEFHYVISLSTNTVTLAKFNPDDLTSTPVSINLTLTAKPDED